MSQAKRSQDLGVLAPVLEAIVDRVVERLLPAITDGVVERLRPLLDGNRDDELVDRETAGVSKRWWDRSRGTLFPVFKDGRRYVAHRAAVLAALERETRFQPNVARARPRAAEVAELDDDIRNLLGPDIIFHGPIGRRLTRGKVKV